MPVSGPNKEFAYKLGEKATKAILRFLETEYHVYRPTPDLLLGEKLQPEWDALEKKLQEIVSEMVWIDQCGNW
jgi:hypothetical protein